jgi:hypothetical protein
LMVELCFKGKIIFWSTWLFLLIMILIVYIDEELKFMFLSLMN